MQTSKRNTRKCSSPGLVPIAHGQTQPLAVTKPWILDCRPTPVGRRLVRDTSPRTSRSRFPALPDPCRFLVPRHGDSARGANADASTLAVLSLYSESERANSRQITLN
ncbi:hypothetical protein EVAR_13902_1 [Eumeta japonica]|uniref:Uncharacterized protein n=1 Tax=Eumeta variegata TaxID=151549 RepID=A0A4C1U895_EUMVA|nr:hypothetical protein EVAR_13902_1 [Eumeta japonica]